MYVDNNTFLSNAQAVTATAVSTNIIDTQAASEAVGTECYIEFLVNTAATAAGAATVQFELQTATDAAFTAPVTLFITGAIGKATLVAGYRPAVVRIPTGSLRFLRANYTVATGPLTAGKFDARIILDENIRIG